MNLIHIYSQVIMKRARVTGQNPVNFAGDWVVLCRALSTRVDQRQRGDQNVLPVGRPTFGSKLKFHWTSRGNTRKSLHSKLCQHPTILVFYTDCTTLFNVHVNFYSA